MESTIITLRRSDGRGWDLELPADVPLRSFLPQLRDALGLHERDAQIYHEGRAISESSTLSDTGVLTGAILTWAPYGAKVLPAGILRLPSGRRLRLSDLAKNEIKIGRPGRTRPEIDTTSEPEGDTVSREHAIVSASGDSWTLRIISERNKSWVNDELIPPGRSHALRSGDKIRLGKMELIFES